MKAPSKNSVELNSVIAGIALLGYTIFVWILIPRFLTMIPWIISILLEGNEIPHA